VAQPQRVYIKSTDPEFAEAEQMAKRMWEAMAPENAQIERVAAVTGLALLLAQFADCYINKENYHHFLQEVARNALSIIQQSEAGGVSGGVQ
jgi:putative NIF3 family GTP cyclohydrolase 1 type 2